MDELAMYAAALKQERPHLKAGNTVICISPTRGMQLARVAVGPVGLLVLQRVGGPASVLEEEPDILTDALPFMVVEHVLELVKHARQLETH